MFEIKTLITAIDQAFYQDRLAGFLPDRMIDFHTHIWLKTFSEKKSIEARGQTWPRLVAEENSIEELLETYRLMFPMQQVTPLLFGWPERNANLQMTNDYTALAARNHNLPALLIVNPGWTAEELVQRVQAGGFLGLKPYLNWAPEHIPSQDIQIYDFLTPAHLEAANQHGWIVVLHIPRPRRLSDPVNLQQMLEIEKRYPQVKLVIAHLGRAYCPEDMALSAGGNAFDVLRESERMLFDFSANTNADVMEAALRSVGPHRLVFGSDLPIVRMRMRRICEQGTYINLVPPGVYGDLSDDPHMREVSQVEAEQLSFFMYEELYAFRRAAEAVGLTTQEVEAVFYTNAARLIESAKAKATR